MFTRIREYLARIFNLSKNIEETNAPIWHKKKGKQE